MSTRPLRFGAFFAPFHPVGQSPTLALEHDLQRVEELDRLGDAEAWFGEHHSRGYELIGCPEIFIAAAAGRTKQHAIQTHVEEQTADTAAAPEPAQAAKAVRA